MSEKVLSGASHTWETTTTVFATDVENAVRIHAARVAAGHDYISSEQEAQHCVMMAMLIRAVAVKEALEQAGKVLTRHQVVGQMNEEVPHADT